MNKEEIVSKMNILTEKVKSPGRSYSKAQREDMRMEISNLSMELGKIKIEEDIAYVIEFEKNHPSFFISEREELKNKIIEIDNNITDSKLIFVLKFKIKSFFSEIEYIAIVQKEIGELKAALDYLNKNESIPVSSPHCYKEKDKIQKTLATNCRAVNSRINKLNSLLVEIQQIISFFINENKLTGFIYLSKAIFSEATNFEKGYATVIRDSQKLYFAYNKKAYKIESEEKELPKIAKQRANPDLIPFELKDGNFNYLMGYKNSSNELVIPAKYRSASPFINGFAKVGREVEGRKTTLYGLIDKAGREVLHCDFIEIGDVFNDVVIYKKNIYNEGYVRTSSLNFDTRNVVKHLGLFCGYLILDEIKPALFSEIEKIFEIENSIEILKTKGELDNAQDRIRGHQEIIDFYLKYITNN